MAIIQTILNVLTILVAFSKLSLCLYEDQIGKFDWKQSYVGKVKFASFDSVKRIIVATEENVIAAINIKNGQILWRHVLEESPGVTVKLLNVDKEIITITGNENTFYVRGWELNNGVLLWEWCLHTEATIAEWVVYKDKLIHIVPVLNSHLEVTEYEVHTGKNRGSTSKITAPWVTDLSKCVLAETYWSCISGEDSSGFLYYINTVANNNEPSKIYQKNIDQLIGNVPGKVGIAAFKYTEPSLLLTRNNVGRLIVIEEDTVNVLPNSFSLTSIAVPNGDQILVVDLKLNDEQVEKPLIIKTIEIGAKENVIETEYMENLGYPIPIVGICRGSACRLLISTSDNALCLLQLPNGKILWKREESLSDIAGVEFVELPVSELDASIEREFTTTSNDVLSMLYNRLLTQTRQLSAFLSGKQMTSNKLVRDEFGLHKLIIIITKIGKFFAIDNLSGEIIWTKVLHGITSFTIMKNEVILLYEQRNARYPPLAAEYALVGRDNNTGNGILFRFDPITGHSRYGLEKLSYQIKQIMLVPYEDETHLKALLILSKDDTVHVYPDTAKGIVKEYLNSLYMYTVNTDKSILNGYSFDKSENDDIRSFSTWKLSLGQSKIVAMSVRPSIERVHSQGRVLADRSVLYKYVNPNLIALATLNEDPLHKHVLSIYLVDGITGLIIYSANHKRAKGPVHLVHSENWVVYSYYSERFRRVEIASIELYEGVRQSNSTAFSSHALSQLPQVETLACILSANPLVMVSTLTERGITNKHLLIALSNGAVNELPWIVVEPRGPHILPGPDENSIPYMPELPLVPEATINYNQSLARIRGISVSPARLESTTLVFVYGLDLFYTRVTPSKTFDMLKEDFDHWLIVMVLVGLTVSSYITKQLASRKALKQAWK
ncbi:hypothetical protein Trydic_g15100 [Trypoxylus dichotomus]